MYAGTVNVTLNDGAKVGGTIASLQGTATSTLTFAMTVSSQADKNALSTALSSQGSTGSVVVNGNTYSWSGFGNLQNLLKVVAQQASGATVTINVNRTASENTPDDYAQPTMGCDNPHFRLSDRTGTLSLLAKLPGARLFAMLGQFAGTKFVPAVSGWTIKWDVPGHQFDVFDPGKTKETTCVL